MSFAGTNNTYKIDPLNGDNYAAWQCCLEWILGNLDLWDVTNGTKEYNDSREAVITDWKKKDKKARKEICLHISDEHLVYVDQYMTSNAIWTRPQSIFESKGAVSIVCDFFHTFTKDRVNMEEHVCKLQGLGQELNDCGQLITDMDFSNTLLTSLLESWSSFITAVNAAGWIS